jgi:hypothetical protein
VTAENDEARAELLAALLAERFPTFNQGRSEQHRGVPAAHYARGGAGMTRLEMLLLRAKSGRATAPRETEVA